jgi:hypothetical protein
MRFLLFSFIIVSLTVSLLVSFGAAVYAQQDVGPANRFAQTYNAYFAIDPRIQDLKALKRMMSNWRALVKSQGWPQDKCHEQ